MKHCRLRSMPAINSQMAKCTVCIMKRRQLMLRGSIRPTHASDGTIPSVGVVLLVAVRKRPAYQLCRQCSHKACGVKGQTGKASNICLSFWASPRSA